MNDAKKVDWTLETRRGLFVFVSHEVAVAPIYLHSHCFPIIRGDKLNRALYTFASSFCFRENTEPSLTKSCLGAGFCGGADAALTFEDLAEIALADLPHKRDPVVADGPLRKKPAKNHDLFFTNLLFGSLHYLSVSSDSSCADSYSSFSVMLRGIRWRDSDSGITGCRRKRKHDSKLHS